MIKDAKATKITALIALQYLSALLIILFVKTELGLVGEFIKNVLFYILIFTLPNVIIIKKVCKEKPASYLRLGLNPKSIVTGIVIGAFMFLIFLISNQFKTNDITFKAPQILMLTGGILAGIFEEIAFRGFYLNFFQTKFSFTISSILTSALFSLLHINQILTEGLVPLVMLFILSLFLNYSYEKTKSLWVPIIIHMTFNILIFLFR